MPTLNTAKKCNEFFKTNVFNDENPLKIPADFANLIDKNNPNDPLLKQIFLDNKTTLGSFSKEPVLDSNKSPVAGLIHKYHNRVLLITTSSCEIFCRYCFRQNFPYEKVDILKNWDNVEKYLQKNTQLNEVILSGGDPLSLSDEKLSILIKNIEKISHIKTIRIHSRTFSIIKSRITNDFINLINNAKCKIVIVSHINHANEITQYFAKNIKQLNCQILNQSVVLKGVNDNSQDLIELSNKLWEVGILPYYLNMLDKVSGSEDYFVSDDEVFKIYKNMQKNLSGYLLPKLVRDDGSNSKTIYASNS
jgi:EF-P beta-lysylation protein EpmB